MKYSLINPKHIRFNGLEFYDNPARDEEFYVELYDNLKILIQFKGTKSTLQSRVPTRQWLETCQHFDITGDHEWYPQSIDLNKIIKISQARSIKAFFLPDTMGHRVSFTIIGSHWSVICLPKSNIWWGYNVWNQPINFPAKRIMSFTY